MSQVFFVLNSAPTEAQSAECGPTRKAQLVNKWLMTVSADGDPDVVGPTESRLSALEAQSITRSIEWNGEPPE